MLAWARQPLPSAQVTLVSPFSRSLYSGMVPGFVAGHYTLDDCTVALSRLAAAAKVRRIESAAVGLDAARREVSLADGSKLHYDVLSVDTGPVVDRAAIPGAREHALFVRPIEHFIRLWTQFEARSRSVGAGLSLVTGAAAPLASYSPRVQALGRAALRRAGVTVFDDQCVEVRAKQVVLASGMRLGCDAPMLALGPSAPGWLLGSGLLLDDRGFIATGATLQSTSHADVFAAGDVASRIDMPQPKSGVVAVRAGPPLAFNLRRFLGGGELRAHTPQRHGLSLIGCGDARAIASYGPWSAEGRWVWRWKEHIDRAFVERFRVPPA
jgi:NADH dehydrogenase FAD-containing subunit